MTPEVKLKSHAGSQNCGLSGLMKSPVPLQENLGFTSLDEPDPSRIPLVYHSRLGRGNNSKRGGGGGGEGGRGKVKYAFSPVLILHMSIAKGVKKAGEESKICFSPCIDTSHGPLQEGKKGGRGK